MKKSGAAILVYALEQIGVTKTFGIPGVHNAEIYTQLSESRFIEPIIATHELSAGYMADAVSRTTDSIGTMVIVPGAGLTHAMSAISEAYVDGIPLMIISGGINRGAGKSYQMHQIDMERLTSGMVKGYYLIEEPEQIIHTIYDAYNNATNGEPGPVFIEIPLKTQLIHESVELKAYQKPPKENPFEQHKSETEEGMKLIVEKEDYSKILEKAIDLISGANLPGIYVGWGAKEAISEIEQLAELIVAPVSTTIQGVSSFFADHPLHAGIGIGPNSSPAVINAFNNCDCLLAIGVKFSELATGNYQMDVPKGLIHIDINQEVFNKNYPAKLTIEGDAKIILQELIYSLNKIKIRPARTVDKLAEQIKKDKYTYKKSWFSKAGESFVTPGFFYNALRNSLPTDSILVADDGNHMLYTAELFPIYEDGIFISPTDYGAMGYGIPAATGAKLLNRHKTVAAIVGDGGLLMCGNELITAYVHKVGILVFVFRDKASTKIVDELKQNNPKISLDLAGTIDLEGFANAARADYFHMKTDIDISGVLTKAIERVKSGITVIVEVNIDYSRKASFAFGLIKPKSSRISFTEKVKLMFRNKS